MSSYVDPKKMAHGGSTSCRACGGEVGEDGLALVLAEDPEMMESGEHEMPEDMGMPEDMMPPEESGFAEALSKRPRGAVVVKIETPAEEGKKKSPMKKPSDYFSGKRK